MMCPICGAASVVTAHLTHPIELKTELFRVCDHGHKFNTVEVHPTQLADAREMKCAVRNIRRRIERYERDRSIATDSRPAREVAEEHGITDARVRQIRAAMRAHAEAWAARKYLPST